MRTSTVLSLPPQLEFLGNIYHAWHHLVWCLWGKPRRHLRGALKGALLGYALALLPNYTRLDWKGMWGQTLYFVEIPQLRSPKRLLTLFPDWNWTDLRRNRLKRKLKQSKGFFFASSCLEPTRRLSPRSRRRRRSTFLTTFNDLPDSFQEIRLEPSERK